MKIGNLFLLGYAPENIEIICDLTEKYGLGGIILFERNLKAQDQLRNDIDRLCQCSRSNIIVCVDQEGGKVNRLQKNAPVFRSPRYYSDSSDIKGLQHAIKITSGYLHKFGINLNLVPVCDVLTNSENKLMQKRVFGTDPDQVCHYIDLVIDSYRSFSIGCCAKHFPGLGSARVDPHIQTSITDVPQDQFGNIHWKPFRTAIRQNVEMVMTTHLVCTQLDPDNMATFSRIVVDNYLREHLTYDGVIITDDLGMGGVQSFSADKKAIGALKAGHDMIMFCHDLEEQKTALEAVNKAVETGQYESEEIMLKIDRVNKLKSILKNYADTFEANK